MLCDDPLVRAFRRLGYSVVRYPSAIYRPLLLLEADGRRAVRVIGPLASELPSTAPLPTVRTGDAAPDIGLESTRRLSGKLAFDVLEPLLSVIGAGASVSAAVSRTSSASVSLTGVSRDSVTVGDLARYLEGELTPTSHHVEDAAKKGDLYVVTSVLRSATLSMRVDATVASEAKAAVSAANAVKVSVGPTSSTDHSCELTFIGATPLAFAFQALTILYEGGVYMDFATATGLHGFELTAQGDVAPQGALLVEDDLVEISPLGSGDQAGRELPGAKGP